MDLMDQLRNSVRASGETMAAVARRAGVPYSVLHGVMESGCNLNVGTFQKLAAALNLEIRIHSKTDTGKKA